MNQRIIGISLILIALLIGSLTLQMKFREDKMIDSVIMTQGGSCYLEDGTCLHDDRSFAIYILGGVLAGLTGLFGVYLLAFDMSQQMFRKQHLEVSKALRDAKVESTKKDSFDAFLKAFDDDEQKVLRAVKDQDGILQSTLRYRAGVSKSSLSLMLKRFEEKKVVSRKPSGKTNKVFLRL